MHVEHIGYGAFENSRLSSVTFAKGTNLLTISWRAFYGASNISEITLPDSVIDIDYYAFANCKALNTFNFSQSDNLKGIYEGAFFGCQNLSNIVIPDTVLAISNYAFYGCMSLDKLPLSESTNAEYIGDYAFSYTGLRKLIVPEQVIYLGKYAFKGSMLETIEVSDAKVEDLYMDFGVFADCNHLEELTVPFAGASLGDMTYTTGLGYLFGAGSSEAASLYIPQSLKDINILRYCLNEMSEALYKDCTELEIMIIPEGTVSIGNYTFSGCTSLKTVVIPDSVISIGSCAFENCISLESIVIPDSVKSIGAWAFAGCTALENVVIPDSITELGGYNGGVFRNCTSLKNVVIPEGVTVLPDATFYGCTSLERVTIPKSLQRIVGHDTFKECPSLTSVYYNGSAVDWMKFDYFSPLEYGVDLYCEGELLTNLVIPDGVKTINRAFSGCTSIQRVVIPNSVESISNYAFRDCTSLESVNIPNSLMAIGAGMFRNCASLQSITIPESVMSLGDQAFAGCTSLERIIVPDSVINIGAAAFKDCTSLKHIKISSSITQISSAMLAGCSSLEIVSIPSSVTYVGQSAFGGCSVLKKIDYIGDAHGWFNIEFADDFSPLWGEADLYYNGVLVTDLVIPQGVTAISKHLRGCSSLKSVVVPDSVTDITDAFNGCRSLERVALPETVTIIGKRAFANCSSLMEVSMSDAVYFIDDDAFKNCISLQSLTVPASLAGFGGIAGTAVDRPKNQPFDGCVNLTEIINKSELPLKCGYGGHGYLARYAIVLEDAQGNRHYRGVEDGDECFETEDGFIFRLRDGQYTLLAYVGDKDTITLPQNFEGNEYSIYEFRGGKNVIIPEGVTRIDNYAFRNCSAMESIVLPDSVESIGKEAFYGCKKLESFKIPKALTVVNLDFTDCQALMSIALHDDITSLTLLKCSALNKIHIPDGVEYVSLTYAPIDSIVVPESVTELHLYFCDSLESVTLTEGLINLSLNNCSRLQYVDIPEGVTTVNFKNCSSLTKVDLPESVNFVYYDAFTGCSSLATITIPGSLKSCSFQTCYALTSVIAEEGVTSLNFSDCPALTMIQMPTTLQTLNLSKCGALANVVLPQSITSLEINECQTLANIDIPQSITSLKITNCDTLKSIETPTGAEGLQVSITNCDILTKLALAEGVTRMYIAECGLLTAINIPNSVETISAGSFVGTKINRVDISENHPYFICYDGVLYTKDLSNVVAVLYGVTEITLPATLTSISDSAFKGCTALETIVIPDGVTVIGAGAFNGCKALKSITIPKSVTEIGNRAFCGCSALKDVYYKGEIADWMKIRIQFTGSYDHWNDSSPLTYGANLYLNGKLLRHLVIPSTVTEIGQNAFMGCASLESVVIPSSVKSIEYSAFKNCAALATVSLPDSITSIGKYAFADCSSLVSIDIPNSITEIEEGVFSGCSGLINITIPVSVTSFSTNAFYSTPRNVYYEGDVEQWMKIGFASDVHRRTVATPLNGPLYCKGKLVTNVIVQDGVTWIPDGVFYGCKSLISVTLPDSVTGIGYAAFDACSSLMRITIGTGLTAISQKDVFAGCENLKTIINRGNMALVFGSTSNGNIAYYAERIQDADGTIRYRDGVQVAEHITTPDGFVFELNQGVYTLIAYIGGEPTITLPKNINGSTYHIRKFLGGLHVIIPEGITSIDAEAFSGCTSLVSITIPESVTHIGASAFSGCMALKAVTLPQAVTSIENGTFDGCTSLENIVIGESVHTIGSNAFSRCKSLAQIALPDSVMHIGTGVFWECTSLESIKLSDQLSEIPYEAFSGCTALKSLVIPDNAESIGGSAFRGCTSLESVTTGHKTSWIGQSAFADCTSLKTLILRNGISYLDRTAFQNCTALADIRIGGTPTSGSFLAILEGKYQYDENSNWVDGCLYVDRCLIKVREDVTTVVIRPDTIYIDPNAFEGCYLLKEVTLGGDHPGLLKGVSNLETLTITSMPSHSISQYFSSGVPITLSKIILKSGCDVENAAYFQKISGVTIFVEKAEENCHWHKQIKNWNNGNKTVFGEKWYSIRYFNADGTLLTTHCYKLSEVITPPYMYSYSEGDKSYTFVGWDADGDGIADGLPAAINQNYDLRAVFAESDARYRIEFVDKDGRTVLYSYELAFGEKIFVPEAPKKGGYQFLGWLHVPEFATSDLRIYSDWDHNGNGHEYESIWISPSCEKRGYKLHRCKHCGESYKSDLSNAKGHEYGEWKLLIAATCEEDGYMYRECECGNVQKMIIDAKGHDDTVTVLEESTCKHTGKAQYVCKTCGKTHIEKLPHSEHQYEKTYTDLPSLEKLAKKYKDLIYGTENGEGYYFLCVECKRVASLTANLPKDAVGIQSSNLHVPGEWIDLFEASCDVDGYKGSYCTTCNELVEVMVVESYGHTHKAYDYNENCHWSLCSVCGDAYGHEDHMAQDCQCGWSGISVTANGNIAYTVEERNVTVNHTQACIVAYKDAATGNYIVLHATINEDGYYTYHVPAAVAKITVAVRGDYDGDGELTQTDVNLLQKVILGKDEHHEMSMAVCDVNNDGRVSIADLVLVNATRLGKISLKWMD